jgi:hypothetical protein
MPAPKKSAGKAKVLIKNLGSAAGKEIGTADAKSIRGGTDYTCPSKRCRTLIVKLAVTAEAFRTHKVVINTAR